ncbi:MAG: protein kinase, partial [Planctomycetales bacterium]|nr:protein kinase [Planctomycetales bacterium]
LHRDIKPANVLVNQYGRPMLADFNISFRTVQEGGVAETAFGGTLAFMAPEHLDAFDPGSSVTPREVNEQSDIYSLGIVIYELLTGHSPFPAPPPEENRVELIRALAETRRTAAPPLDDDPPSARKTLLRTIAWSLSPSKYARPKSAAQFAAALDGCQDLRSAEREIPPPSWFARSAWRPPFAWMVLLAVLPQAVGSAVNIAYNLTEIVDYLTEAQKEMFLYRLVPIYNAIVYPLLISVWLAAAAPVNRMWKRLHSSQVVPEFDVALARRRALNLPYWMLGIAAAGWLPGGLIFPVLLDYLLPDPLPLKFYLHFLASFALSGLIAVAYSFCGQQFIALRVLYPRMWSDPTNFRRIARRELASTPLRLWLINFLSTAIPLVAIALLLLPLVWLYVTQGVTEHVVQIAVVALIVALVLLGLLGREVTTISTSLMARTYAILIRSQS